MKQTITCVEDLRVLAKEAQPVRPRKRQVEPERDQRQAQVAQPQPGIVPPGGGEADRQRLPGARVVLVWIGCVGHVRRPPRRCRAAL